MDPLILDMGSHVAPSVVRRYYLDVHPRLAEALAQADARIVTFRPEFGAEDLLAATQDALHAAIEAVPRDILPLLVADVGLPDLLAACRPFTGMRLTVPALACPRGAFLGYLAFGEGSVSFFRADGERGAPVPEAILALLETAPR